MPVTGVHLVGSIPLPTEVEVFEKVTTALPGRLFSIPDGEPKERGNYIGWQLGAFPKDSIKYFLGGTDAVAHRKFSLSDIGPSNYDTAALKSYETFINLRGKGKIPEEVRLQICLPPPLNCVQGHTRREFHSHLEPLYEQRMVEALDSIISNIPARDLAIQWDVCFEIATLEYERGRITEIFFEPDFFKVHFSPVKQGILDRLARLSKRIPKDIPLGFHLCYGDFAHKHFTEPEDLGLLVDLANGITEALERPVNWFHMPVPKSRDDIAYFTPLKNLRTSARLFLGLVHANGEDGTLRRIKAAEKILGDRDFGVATECGMGRTPVEELDSILRISKNASQPYAHKQ
ncbi:hypothetical protein F5884DRAFT_407685 [Xylogone sp. PMI_703]|nr:hypothetical protein F5884DRAFT_407685 [Xylogone sp. PMI_703]